MIETESVLSPNQQIYLDYYLNGLTYADLVNKYGGTCHHYHTIVHRYKGKEELLLSKVSYEDKLSRYIQKGGKQVKVAFFKATGIWYREDVPLKRISYDMYALDRYIDLIKKSEEGEYIDRGTANSIVKLKSLIRRMLELEGSNTFSCNAY